MIFIILPYKWVIELCLSSFLAILFLQSGLDKVFNWQGNLSWLKDFFSKTFLNGQVPFMLGVITLTEVGAGVASLLGFGEILLFQTTQLAYLGAFLSAITFIMLFFGQRIAQDYTGAGNIVPYFVVSILAIIVFGSTVI